MVSENERPPPPPPPLPHLASSKLARHLQGLYVDAAPLTSTTSPTTPLLQAQVLDVPPSSATPDADAAADAAWASPSALRSRLHARPGSLVGLGSGLRPATVQAWGSAASNADADLALPPVLAHNLGLLRLALLRPFLGGGGGATSGGGGKAPPTAPPLIPLEAETLVDAGWEGDAEDAQEEHPLAITVAAAVRIRRVAVPTTTPLVLSPLAQAQGGQGGEGDEAAAAAVAEEEDPSSSSSSSTDALLEALQRYFTSGARRVARGDVFGVLVPQPKGTAEARGAGGGGGAAAAGDPDDDASLSSILAAVSPVYFRVVGVDPVVVPAPAQQQRLRASASSSAGGAARRRPSSSSSRRRAAAATATTTPAYLVDPNRTALTLLGGSARALLPVGFVGYEAAAMAMAARGGRRGALDPPANPPPLLGIHASAAWHPSPRLPGVAGPLQPLWRRVASVAAPLLHPSAARADAPTSLLLHGPRGAGKATAARAAAAALGLHFIACSCHDLAAAARPAGGGEGGPAEGLAAAWRALVAEASRFAPCVLLLRHLSALASGGGGGDPSSSSPATLRLADCLAEEVARHCSSKARRVVAEGVGVEEEEEGDAAGDPPPPGLVFVVGSCARRADLPPALGRCFTHEVEAGVPDRDACPQLLGGMMGMGEEGGGDGDATIEDAGRRMVGLVVRDVAGVAADALSAADAERVDVGEYVDALAAAAATMASTPLPPTTTTTTTTRHLETALSRVKARTATEIGAPQVPDVKWEDVGGLSDVKRALLDTVELPLRHRDLFSSGLRRRSGVLLYGPPGSGKTLLAKAVATQCAANFLSVKGPELINMYVGESERQVREAFARARRARPCVMFFDELDSLAPARGAAGDSGGVMDRVVAQLLAEIDAAQEGGGGGEEGGGGGGSGGDVFVIGATNRPDLIDPALLRPGRLDTLLYVGIPEEPEAKLPVLRALTRKFKLDSDVDLEAIAALCPATLSGADLYGLCADAWALGLKRALEVDDEGDIQEEEEDDEVVVRQRDFVDALSALKPSLSREELDRYLALKAHYDARQGFCDRDEGGGG
jgi:SpoVK/Ycf46/Vps4 family AAA+-type ATPase